VVLFDTSRAAVAYRIDNPSGSSIADWDLQADGKVVLALASDRDHRASLVWYSPDDPAPHPLPLPAAFAWDVHIAGNAIAYLRSTGTPSDWYFGAVGVTDLAGHSHAVANRAIARTQSHSSFAFDGSNVTWAAPACFGATLHSQTADEPAVNTARPTCPLRFASPPRLLSSGIVFVPVRCSGFVLPDCGGSDLTLRSVKQHVLLGDGEVRSCNATADVYLTRRGRALVRRLKRLRVKATTTVYDADRAREVRSTTFTLRTRGPRAHRSSCEDDF
jgi:hypothetical protein